MLTETPSRRDVIRTSALVAGSTLLASAVPAWSAPSTGPAGRTATDQVTLGNTGIKLSRLGIGTGINNGHVLTKLGKDAFVKLIRYAYDKGITYIDCAQAYSTFDWVGDAMKDLPREKLFLQSKVPGQPRDILATIDRHRSTYKTDYIDSLLVHCMVQPNWVEDWKFIRDGFDQAQEKKWIRAKGVSCHSLPALQNATRSDWAQVHLVRVNPFGRFMDGPNGDWTPKEFPIDPVLAEVKTMRAKGRGIIGMKIMGNGTFDTAEERDKSVRFAMANPNIDAVVIGMKSTDEIDDNIAMINRALAAA